MERRSGDVNGVDARLDADAPQPGGATQPAEPSEPSESSESPVSAIATAEGAAGGDEARAEALFESAADLPVPERELEALSLAEVEKRRFRPLAWIGFFVLALAAVVLPYWLGRNLAINRTAEVTARISDFEPRGIALVAWAVTMFAFVGIGMAVVQTRTWLWRFVFVVALAAEQFISGLCLLRTDFWYATYVVYGRYAQLANAADLGIIAAAAGVAVFAVLFVSVLVLIRKDSPLNVLTRSWAAFTMFFVVETVALMVVLFGGLLTTV